MTNSNSSTKTIAEAFVSARTTKQKTAANRRLSAYVRQRSAAGFNPTMVKAGVKSWITRLSS